MTMRSSAQGFAVVCVDVVISRIEFVVMGVLLGQRCRER
jgi:hypothetical protein